MPRKMHHYYYASLTIRYQEKGDAPRGRWCLGWSNYHYIRERLLEEGGPFLPDWVADSWFFPDVLRGPLPYELEFQDPVEFYPVAGEDGLLAGYLFRRVHE